MGARAENVQTSSKSLWGKWFAARRTRHTDTCRARRCQEYFLPAVPPLGLLSSHASLFSFSIFITVAFALSQATEFISVLVFSVSPSVTVSLLVFPGSLCLYCDSVVMCGNQSPTIMTPQLVGAFLTYGRYFVENRFL